MVKRFLIFYNKVKKKNYRKILKRGVVLVFIEDLMKNKMDDSVLDDDKKKKR